MKKEIIFTYSKDWKGIKKFRKLSMLLRFIRRIPDWELPYTSVMKKEKDFWIKGAYYKTKNGLITIKF